MIVYTIQSKEVIGKLIKGETYVAKYKYASFTREYKVLSKLLWNDSNICPIFGAGCGKRDLFDECWNPFRDNDSYDIVNIELDIPDYEIINGEFYLWTDIMYYLAFTENLDMMNDSENTIEEDYSIDKLRVIDNDEITQSGFENIINRFLCNLQETKFEYMQIILKYIKPEWLVSYKNI